MPEVVNVRMPDELHAELRARAEAEDRSMAATIRYAVRLYLAGPACSGAKDTGRG